MSAYYHSPSLLICFSNIWIYHSLDDIWGNGNIFYWTSFLEIGYQRQCDLFFLLLYDETFKWKSLKKSNFLNIWFTYTKEKHISWLEIIALLMKYRCNEVIASTIIKIRLVLTSWSLVKFEWALEE